MNNNYLIMERFAYTIMGTFGRLYLNERTIYTVEQPWNNNERNISCIPIGIYKCKPRFYHRGGYESIEITNVPNRKYILFHKGNTMLDIKGCIALNNRLGYLHGLWAGLESKEAFNAFIKEYGGKVFYLLIKDVFCSRGNNEGGTIMT